MPFVSPSAGLAFASRALALAFCVVAACVAHTPFGCLDASQCDTKAQGICVAPGYCAFEDPGCPSELRYDDSAASALAGRCVEPIAEDSTDATTDVLADSTPGSTGAAPSDTSSEDSGTDDQDSGGDSSCGAMPCPCSASVSIGLRHTCVRRTDGSSACFGTRANAQLGDGLVEPVIGPNPVIVDVADFTGLSATDNHTCATAADGGAWCWGRNEDHQSDPTLPGDPEVNPETVAPTKLDAVQGAVLAMTGLRFSCVLDDATMMTCWGSNSRGQLGTQGSGPGPLVSGPHAPDETVMTMAGGQEHACMATASTVLCWGSNEYGQNGGGGMVGNRFNPTEVALEIGTGVVGVATGRYHTCAAVDGGNQVYCWGRNGCSQVGGGTNNCGDSTKVYTPTLIDVPGPVVQLVATRDHTCALTSEREAYCWGGKSGYWLGTEEAPGALVWPVSRVVVADDIPEPVVEIAVGLEHACGRAASGRLWCWGSTMDGAVGPNPPSRQERVVEVDVGCAP